MWFRARVAGFVSFKSGRKAFQWTEIARDFTFGITSTRRTRSAVIVGWDGMRFRDLIVAVVRHALSTPLPFLCPEVAVRKLER